MNIQGYRLIAGIIQPRLDECRGGDQWIYNPMNYSVVYGRSDVYLGQFGWHVRRTMDTPNEYSAGTG